MDAEFAQLATPLSDAHEAGAPTLLPEMLCNLDRLVGLLRSAGLGGIVLRLRPNVYYMSGYTSKANVSTHDANGYGVVVVPAHDPGNSVLIVPDIELARFKSVPTWLDDVRAYASMPAPSHMPIDERTFDRYVPARVRGLDWGLRARATYAPTMALACRAAMRDLGVDRGQVAFDDLRWAQAVAGDAVTVVDGYDLMRSTRQVKTMAEFGLLRRAASVNERAIEATVRSYSPGMSWLEVGHQYNVEVAKLGGFVHDPGGLVVANAPGNERTFYMDTGADDFDVLPGMHLMLDCHGTLNQYCWDSGKTWIVGAEPTRPTELISRAIAEAMTAIIDAVRPGAHLDELERVGYDCLARMGLEDWESVSIFFHGLGLEHGDVEVLIDAERPYWRIESGQVVSVHIVYPGSEYDRYYLEDNCIATADGGKSLYTWDYNHLSH